MDIDKEQIQELVSRPAEGLSVEVKRWINPEEVSGIAKIVRACFAIRNRNGGYVVFGFDNRTFQPDLSHEPPDVQTTFHLDKIQGILSRYSSEPFEIAVRFGERDGHQYPVIVITGGVTTPVVAKADLIAAETVQTRNRRKLICLGDVYICTLRANGTPSTAVARPEDWPEIMRICFDNREADIGRFLRRQLTGQDTGTLAAALAQFVTIATVPPPPTLRQRAEAILCDGKQRYQRALTTRVATEEERPLLDAGTWEIGMVIDPAKTDAISDQTFMNVVHSSNPTLTGWPVWMDTRTVVDQNARPVVRDDAWEALDISARGRSNHLEFMRLHPKGEFYLLRNLQDDGSDKIPPGSALDPLLVLWRTTEALAVGLALGRGLGWELVSTRLGFAFRWAKLKGRRLEPWSDPFSLIGVSGIAHDDQISTFVELLLDTPSAALAPLVDQATRRLFALFNGTRVPIAVIEDVVRRVLQRRF